MLWLLFIAIPILTIYFSRHIIKGYLMLFYFRYSQLSERNDVIEITPKCLQISYTYHSEKYNLFVPIKNEIKFPMTNSKVYAIATGIARDITQQPGIPYFVNGEMLEAKEIQIMDLDTMETKSIDNKTIPSFI